MILDLIILIGLVLGTCIAVFSIFWGLYWVICYRDAWKREEEYLRPCTKAAKKHKDRVDKQDRFDYKGLKDISDNAKNRKNRKN